MNRLFVFGDSWANNYLSKDTLPFPFLSSKAVEEYARSVNYYGHWIDHLSNFYNTKSFALGGACNEQIIYQIGNLPPYIPGDRVVIILGVPERYSWTSNGILHNINFKSKVNIFPKSLDSTSYSKFLLDQLVERAQSWDLTPNSNEKKFLNLLPVLLQDYSPVVLSWCKQTVNFLTNVHYIGNDIDYIQYSTIEMESNGVFNDGHLGVEGNYELFKFISKLLNIDTSKYSPSL